MTHARIITRAGPQRFAAVGAIQGVRVVGSLATLPLAAHLLLPSAFARLAACVCVAQVIAVALDGGVAATGYALLQTASQPARTVFRHVTATKLRNAAIFAVVALGVAAIPRVDPAAVLAAYAYGAAMSLNGFWWLNHQRRMGLALVGEASPVIGLVVGAAALAVWRAPWWVLPLTGAVGAVIPPLLLASGGPPGKKPSTTWGRFDLSAEPLRVGFTRVLIAGYTLALIPAAALRFDLRAVAAYAACDKVASIAGMLGLIAAQALAPLAAGGQLAGRWNGRRRAGVLVAVLAAAAYLALAAVGGGVAVGLLFGPAYRGLGGCALITFAADGLVGLNTVIWTGVLLPSGRSSGYLRATALGAGVCYAVLLAPLRGGCLQIACARLFGEAAVLGLSLIGLRIPQPSPRRYGAPQQATAT